MKRIAALILIIFSLIGCDEDTENVQQADQNFRLTKIEAFWSEDDELLYSCDFEYEDDRTTLTCLDLDLGEGETMPARDFFTFNFDNGTLSFATRSLDIDAPGCIDIDTVYYTFSNNRVVSTRSVNYGGENCELRSTETIEYEYDNDGRIIEFHEEAIWEGGSTVIRDFTVRYVSDLIVEVYREDNSITRRLIYMDVKKPETFLVDLLDTDIENRVSDNLIISSESFSGGDNTSYTYEFDESGNVTRETGLLNDESWFYQVYTYEMVE